MKVSRKTKTQGGKQAASKPATHPAAAAGELMGEMRKKIEEFSVFHDLAKTMTSSLQLDQVLKTIMSKIQDFMRPDTWSLLLVDEKTNELYFQIATGAGAGKLKDVRLKMGQGIAGWVAQTGQATIVPDVSKDPRFFSEVDKKTEMRTHSIVCVPIRSKDRVLGVIQLINYLGQRGFEQADLTLLQAMADYAAIALENAMQVQRIHELTITDDVTDLFNVRHLHFVLETEIYRSNRYDYHFSLIFLDLDHFKEVNDTHGHLVGSKLLREIADLVRGCLRMIDYAFRYGGDEFVVLLPQTDKESAYVVARRVRDRMNEHKFLHEEGLNLHLTASIGLATYPTDAKTKVDLIRMADEAMYLVKNTTRNNIAAANAGVLQ